MKIRGLRSQIDSLICEVLKATKDATKIINDVKTHTYIST